MPAVRKTVTAKRIPYTWRVGVDNAFGYLGSTTGSGEQLVESRRFHSDRRVITGVAVSLDNGSVVLTPADGSQTWRDISCDRACELAGIPSPAVDGEAETARRLDPFHVERHTSAVFVALVALIHDHGLPCAHALRAWYRGIWNGGFDDAYLEQAETFSASVLERVARTRVDLHDAVVAELARDLALQPGDAEAIAVVRDSGWSVALPELAERVAATFHELEDTRTRLRSRAAEDDSQLALI